MHNVVAIDFGRFFHQSWALPEDNVESVKLLTDQTQTLHMDSIRLITNIKRVCTSPDTHTCNVVVL